MTGGRGVGWVLSESARLATFRDTVLSVTIGQQECLKAKLTFALFESISIMAINGSTTTTIEAFSDRFVYQQC